MSKRAVREETTLFPALQSEYDAIDMYTKLIGKSGTDIREKIRYREILGDEENHIKRLEKYIPESKDVWVLVWEQPDYDGRDVRLRREFASKKEMDEFISQHKESAQYLGKSFDIIHKGQKSLLVKTKYPLSINGAIQSEKDAIQMYSAILSATGGKKLSDKAGMDLRVILKDEVQHLNELEALKARARKRSRK